MMTLARPLLLATLLFGTTKWCDTKITCPLCSTENTFQTIVSYGSYIYAWPSKYQYLFWPLTDKNVAYSCRKCRLTCLMGDFKEIPKEKFDVIRKQLEGVKLETHEQYYDIPMVQRLEVAEKVYGVIGKNDEFWCLFHRVKGYHLEEAKKPKEALASRKKALDFALKLIKDESKAGRRKQLLFISGSMRCLTGDNAGALKDLEAAAKLTYREEDKERSENIDAYLSEVIGEFIDALKAGHRPDRTPEEKK